MIIDLLIIFNKRKQKSKLELWTHFIVFLIIVSPIYAQFTPHPLSPSLTHIQIADLSGDLTPDLIGYNPTTETILWQPNNGTGQFNAPQPILQPNLTFVNYQVADIDGDGDMDLMAAVNDNAINWYANDGTGSFGPPNLVLDSLRNFNNFTGIIIKMADVDGDGDIDLSTFDVSQDSPTIMLNDGIGNFAPQVRFNGLNYFGGFIFGDLDGDGDEDALSPLQGQLRWNENDGSAGMSFANSIIIQGEAIYQAAISDLDKDGSPDIIVSASNKGNLWWLKNDGSQNFGNPIPIFSEIGGPVKIALGDFDQDGDTDIFAGAFETQFSPFNSNQRATLFLNDGLGNFTPPILLFETGNHTTLTVADFNQDSFEDVIYYTTDTSGWYENQLSTFHTITGFVFNDTNENGLYNAPEKPLRGIEIVLNPGNLRQTTLRDGTFQFLVENGSYELSHNVIDCWDITTDATSYQLEVQDNVLSDLNFGFKSNAEAIEFEVDMQVGIPRCGRIVPVWVSVTNSECTPASGGIDVTVSANFTIHSVKPTPFNNFGNIVSWVFDTLQPNETVQFQINLNLPGFFNLGAAYPLTSITGYQDSTESFVLVDTTQYWVEILCSFDPNDKLVNRIAIPETYTPEEQALDYTIRFQNTGNDVAFVVRLEDTLSTDLDWTTFKAISASHDKVVNFDATTGYLSVLYENILLPDSSSNEPESHGFFKFSILPKPNLPAGTNINNGAAIYFDGNEPVITNIVQTDIQGTVSITELMESDFLKIFPNPASHEINASWRFPISEEAYLNMHDLWGKRVSKIKIRKGTADKRINTSNLSNGIYLLELQENHQHFRQKVIIQH